MNELLNSPGEIRESYLTLHPDPSDPISSILRKLEKTLGEHRGEVLEVRVFGAMRFFPVVLSTIRSLPGSDNWPLVFLDGTPSPMGGVAGIQLHLIEGAAVDTVRLDETVVGRTFETEDARFMVLGGLGPVDSGAIPARQTTDTLLRMEAALGTHDMDLRNLVRTWFFLDDILGWYGEFNGARTQIFEDRGIFNGYLPASTGIGGRNDKGTSLVTSALAMAPKNSGPTIEEIPSPLQCAAGKYGSSFSRAAELRSSDLRKVFVSGTASIDAQGKTAHPGDPGAQIEMTFRVVGAILRARGLGFNDVVRGNAYFRDVVHAPLLSPALEVYGLQASRLVVSQNTVCRDDLLFEMEVEAAGPRPTAIF